MERNRFVPEDKGRIVTSFLKNFFSKYVQYDFTADLEEKLDEVSNGSLGWKQLLRDFWKDFSAAVDEAKDLRVSEVITALDELLGPHIFPIGENGADPRACPSCDNGRLSLKLGRFGAFIGCSNYPECRYTRKLGQSESEAANGQPVVLGADPDTGEPISVRSGRFGPYVQRGDGEKPARGSIPKGVEPSSVDLEYALKLLSLPREIGKHPETGEPITANFGRYGPYVAHQKQYASLDAPDEVFTVGINRAVSLLAERKAKTRAFRAPEPLKELGNAPGGAAIKLMRGRYGPYVTDGTTNATIPRNTDPLGVTLEQALSLIADKVAKGGNGAARKPPRKSAEKSAADAKTSGKQKKTNGAGKRKRTPTGAESG
jgi:DNA topoisomerase-1